MITNNLQENSVIDIANRCGQVFYIFVYFKLRSMYFSGWWFSRAASRALRGLSDVVIPGV